MLVRNLYKKVCQSFHRLFRFSRIYGFRRSVVKAVGRLGFSLPVSLLFFKFIRPKRSVAIVGCGQFSFSTIAYFLIKNFGNTIVYCVDIDERAVRKFSSSYRVPNFDVGEGYRKNFAGAKLVYIASNHATHMEYAALALSQNLDVYVEKPLSVSFDQLDILKKSYKQSQGRLFVGYNRPFSSAIQELKEYIIKGSPVTFNCVVMGHMIPEGHWYRNPDEGTRVCGNLGHWIDLSVYLLNLRGGVESLDILIAYSNVNAPDDDITVVLTSPDGDLITLTLTAREELYEGINETLIFQQNGVFCKIDDFRRMTLHLKDKKIKRRYYPKDVGHERAIMQPFLESERDVSEVFISTELMLYITQMVKKGENSGFFRLQVEYETALSKSY